MANYLRNQVIFSDREDIRPILEDLRREGKGLGHIDFYKVNPVPLSYGTEDNRLTLEAFERYNQYKKDCKSLFKPKAEQKWDDYWKHHTQQYWRGKQAYNNKEKYGFATWDDWTDGNWGAKWQSYIPSQWERGNMLEFRTSWRGIPQIIEGISKRYPKETICYRWADENMAYNVGEITLKNGEIIGQNIPKEGSDKAFELSLRIDPSPEFFFGDDPSFYPKAIKKKENQKER